MSGRSPSTRSARRGRTARRRTGHDRRHRQRRPPETYAIAGEPGSGVIGINGAAASGAPGDLVIIIAYGILNEQEIAEYSPNVVFVDEHNRILLEGHDPPTPRRFGPARPRVVLADA